MGKRSQTMANHRPATLAQLPGNKPELPPKQPRTNAPGTTQYRPYRAKRTQKTPYEVLGHRVFRRSTPLFRTLHLDQGWPARQSGAKRRPLSPHSPARQAEGVPPPHPDRSVYIGSSTHLDLKKENRKREGERSAEIDQSRFPAQSRRKHLPTGRSGLGRVF